MKIGQVEIGGKHTFIIAEIGNNHNGSLERAKQMVDLAAGMGVDCVKFQMRHINELYRKRTIDKSGDDLGTEYLMDLLARFSLTLDEHREVANYCGEKGILYMCTPWDNLSVDVLEDFGVPAYKVASADLTNMPLLDRLAQSGKPLILSTGMSTSEEVKFTADFLNKRNVEFALLHCNSTYPAPLHDINLKWMNKITDVHPIVGYSGHERGVSVSLGAVALGASIIERHFTLDREMEGPDHAASLTVDQFSELTKGIRELEEALGSDRERVVSQGEMINREVLGKSLVSTMPLSAGTLLTAKHIKVISPGQGLSPQNYEALVGKTLRHNMAEEDFFFRSDLDDKEVLPRPYTFRRPWGLPVRYHDFQEYHSRSQPDLFEFHLSYSDLELNLKDYLVGTYNMDFVVHAPELFSGSKLMDLATLDDAYRNESIAETQRVIDMTRALKAYFPKTKCPMIVANIGGFTMDKNLSEEAKQGYYEQFAKSLKKLDMDGVELIPQTMAPFPWHFGGQRYQNLFVKSDEIVKWCNDLNLRMCLDVSHSSLTCAHLKEDIYDFIEQVAPVTAYIHMGDAKGVNGEGLQIGDGDLDFKRLASVLDAGCPEAGFIPEIWQGHKNRGEGFWIALEKLEGLL